MSNIEDKKEKKLLSKLKEVSDFRIDKHKIEYPLYEILFMTLFGLLKGYLTYKELHGWMQYQENNELFKKLFGKKSQYSISFNTT